MFSSSSEMVDGKDFWKNAGRQVGKRFTPFPHPKSIGRCNETVFACLFGNTLRVFLPRSLLKDIENLTFIPGTESYSSAPPDQSIGALTRPG